MKWLALGLFGLALAACGTTEHNQARSSPSPSATARTSTPPSPAAAPISRTVYHVGDQIEVYNDARSVDLVLTVNKVDLAKSGNPYITPHPGNQFLTVDASIENRANQPFDTSVLNFEVRDETGQSYTSSLLPDIPRPPSGQVAPGDKVRGVQAFDVPSGHSFRLYFRASLIGNGQTIIDLGQH